MVSWQTRHHDRPGTVARSQPRSAPGATPAPASPRPARVVPGRGALDRAAAGATAPARPGMGQVAVIAAVMRGRVAAQLTADGRGRPLQLLCDLAHAQA